LSDVTIRKIKLFRVCTMYNIYSIYNGYRPLVSPGVAKLIMPYLSFTVL